MDGLTQLIELRKNILFIAPPAWGKTHLLLNLIKESSRRFVFISPLRALANEFYEKVKPLFESCVLIQAKKDLKAVIDFKILIITPEVCSTAFLESFKDVTLIWDEFHLVHHWGKSFRHNLLELYFWATQTSFNHLLLTATLDAELRTEVARDFGEIYEINLGNRQLKNRPSKTYIYPSWQKNLMIKSLLYSSTTNGVKLVFCKYRNEVVELTQLFNKVGIKSLGCVGGETGKFQVELAKCSDLKIIFATSALSHGVNLPSIAEVYLTYKVSCIDFWIQMVGRGGRKGEQFQLHTMEMYGDFKDKFLAYFRGFLAVVVNILK